MAAYFNDLILWLLGVIQSVADWFIGIAKSIGQWAVDGVLSALAAVIEAIPVPDALSNASTVFGQIPSGVVYLVSAASFGQGLGIVAGAYLVRFLIRRLPLVG